MKSNIFCPLKGRLQGEIIFGEFTVFLIIFYAEVMAKKTTFNDDLCILMNLLLKIDHM